MTSSFSCLLVWENVDENERNTNSGSANNDWEPISQMGFKGPGLRDVAHLAGQEDLEAKGRAEWMWSQAA